MGYWRQRHRNIAFANYFPSTFGITEALRPNSTVQEWEDLQALSVSVGVTYMMNLSEKTVQACPQKYAIFKAIRIWENARLPMYLMPQSKRNYEYR